MLFVVLAGGCHGGGTPSSSVIPQTEKISSLSTASGGPARLWFASCVTCGIAMVPDKEVDLDADSLSGTTLKSFAFSGGHGSPSLDAASPDQRHVYETIFIGNDTFVADVDTQTYGVRYYHIPISAQQGAIVGLVVSPDGRQLYVPTTVRLYVINTVTRTIAHTVPVVVYSPALSPDGKTLYGSTVSKAVAIDTTTFEVRPIACVTYPQFPVAATASSVYVGTANGIRVYNAATLHYVRTLLPSEFIQSLVADSGIARLYALTENNAGVGGNMVAINTTTQTAVKTIPDAFQGPFLDPTTHVVYDIDVPGNFCGYTPPAYGKSCRFTVNSSVPYDVVATH